MEWINKFWCKQSFNRVLYSSQNEELRKHVLSWINFREILNEVGNSLRNLNTNISLIDFFVFCLCMYTLVYVCVCS